MSWDLIIKQKFSAAHFLEYYKGNCENMHGHTFQVEVHIKTDKLDRSGISIDFKQVKQDLKAMLPDHQVLNDIYDFSPSAENLARFFFNELKKTYPVTRVTVWESEDSAASYTET
jgi:6-pyruvoyltetrahydropterin/6-carboxytetrahydropterin synthase